MARVLLAFRDIGLAMPFQESLESGGHTVVWDGRGEDGPIPGEVFDVVMLTVPHGSGDVADELAQRVADYRSLDPVPAVVVVSAGPGDDAAAARAQCASVASTSEGVAVLEAIKAALSHRYAAGLSLAFARGALGIEAFGSLEDQMINVVRASRQADIGLVQTALRWYPQHYVTATSVVAMLRDARVLQVPDIELVKLCDGTRTLQTLVRAGVQEPPATAMLLWALASIGAVELSLEPPGGGPTRRQALIMTRKHLQARAQRLDASTYYDVLELPPSCEIEDIERSVQLLARRYSPEALTRMDLAGVAELAAPLWQQILKARSALSDWGTRGRYNDWLESHMGELHTQWADGGKDLEAAELAYARGQEALVAGEAHAALSHFATAARAFPDHPDYECSLLWARFRSDVARGKDRQITARALRASADAINLGRRPWPRALVALALLCAADGDSGAARWHVREALTIDPSLPAARHLWERLGGDS